MTSVLKLDQLLSAARAHSNGREDPNFRVAELSDRWRREGLSITEIEGLLAKLGLDQIWPQVIWVCSECGRHATKELEDYACPLHGSPVTVFPARVGPIPRTATAPDDLRRIADGRRVSVDGLSVRGTVSRFARELLEVQGQKLDPSP